MRRKRSPHFSLPTDRHRATELDQFGIRAYVQSMYDGMLRDVAMQVEDVWVLLA